MRKASSFVSRYAAVHKGVKSQQYAYGQIAQKMKYVEDKNVIEIVKDGTNHQGQVDNKRFTHWTPIPRDRDLRDVLAFLLAQNYVYQNRHTNSLGLTG